MDPTFSPEAEKFRERLRSFLSDNLPARWEGLWALDTEGREQFLRSWRETLRREGLLAPSWPTAYGGGGLGPEARVVLREEFAKARVPDSAFMDVISVRLVGNILLAIGTEEQKLHFLPKILAGDYTFCQGYSEPDAGSDLASLRCRAELIEDHWVINGSKTWTTGGHLSNWMLLLCRTGGTGSSKYAGLTLLLVPLDQPGVQIDPIIDMNGQHHVNQVFFDGACALPSHVIGRVGEGWRAANAVLELERGDGASTDYVFLADEFWRLVALARESGAIERPVMRQRLAAAYQKLQAIRYIGLRSLTSAVDGSPPGRESSVYKVYWSEWHQMVTSLALDVMGADALLPSGRPAGTTSQWDWAGSPNSVRSWEMVFLAARCETIVAGSSEIQRNIIGERVLGLPR